MSQGGMISSETIEYIIAEIGTKVEAQVPVLVLELRVQAHEHFRHRTLARHVLVGLSDFTVLVSIHHFVLNRMSLFIIHLLIKVKCTWRIAYLMILNGGTRSKRSISRSNTRIVGIVGCRQLRDPTLVPSEVIPQFPSEVVGLDSHGIDIEFNPLVLHLPHVGGDDVCKVRACRSADTVQQVLGPLVIILQGTRNTVVQETKIYPQVIGRRFFPLQVRTIPVRLQKVRAQVLPRRIGTQRVSRQVKIITNFLLSGYPITQTELQVGKHFTRRFHPRFIQNSPGKSDRRERTPTVVRAESGRAVPTKGRCQQVAIHVMPI